MADWQPAHAFIGGDILLIKIKRKKKLKKNKKVILCVARFDPGTPHLQSDAKTNVPPTHQLTLPKLQCSLAEQSSFYLLRSVYKYFVKMLSQNWKVLTVRRRNIEIITH